MQIEDILLEDLTERDTDIGIIGSGNVLSVIEGCSPMDVFPCGPKSIHLADKSIMNRGVLYMDFDFDLRSLLN